MEKNTEIDIDVNENNSLDPPKCCICLSDENINICCQTDKITHIPCNCNYYAHKKCFDKTDTTKCIICKHPYTYTWGNYNGYERPLRLCEKILNYKHCLFVKNNYDACNYFCKKKNYCCWNTLIDFLFIMSMVIKFVLFFFLIIYISGYIVNFLWALIFCDVSKSKCYISPNNGVIVILGAVGIAIFMPFYWCFSYIASIYCNNNCSRLRIIPV